MNRAWRITEFKNPRTGGSSWRVVGYKPNGERIRKNFADQREAVAFRMDCERDGMLLPVVDVPRLTHLSNEQLKAAESVFSRIAEPDEAILAADWWLRRGRQESSTGKAVLLDDAVKCFAVWLDTSHLRPLSRGDLLRRVKSFAARHGSLGVGDITPEVIEAYLGSLGISPTSADNTKRALSRFLSWCVARPQRYISHNPAKEVRIHKPEAAAPSVFTLEECERLLRSAHAFKGGRWLRYISLQLFAGLRPWEALRVPSDQILLADKELRIEAHQSKVKRARVIHLEPAAIAWLRACPDTATVSPNNHRLEWDALRKVAGIERWIVDGLRHTCLSHHFRLHHSYGKTAEMAGNSETIIKRYYQGRVSKDDCRRFWALRPTGGGK